MANVDVRMKDGVKQHRHPGYPPHGSPQWHPVSQHHENGLHEKLGISGNEKPNRKSPEEMAGVRRPDVRDINSKPAKKPTKEEETRQRNAVSSAVSDVASKWINRFKAQTYKPPKNPWAKLLYDATMPVLGFANLIQSKMKEEDAKAFLRGFDKAMERFDEITALSDAKSLESMSLRQLKMLDSDLVRELNLKYREYGGNQLKGKRDKDSLEKKAEIKVYLEIINNLRDVANKKAKELGAGQSSTQTRTSSYNRTNTASRGGSGRRGVTTASIREQRRQQQSRSTE